MSPVPSSADLHVVLVEDDEEVCRSLTMLLEARGIGVDVYPSGRALLNKAPLQTADCLLIDYKMPHMDGLELLAQLRAEGTTTPALLITGFFSLTLRARAQTAGYADVLEKPTDGAVLEEKILALSGG